MRLNTGRSWLEAEVLLANKINFLLKILPKILVKPKCSFPFFLTIILAVQKHLKPRNTNFQIH